MKNLQVQRLLCFLLGACVTFIFTSTQLLKPYLSMASTTYHDSDTTRRRASSEENKDFKFQIFKETQRLKVEFKDESFGLKKQKDVKRSSRFNKHADTKYYEKKSAKTALRENLSCKTPREIVETDFNTEEINRYSETHCAEEKTICHKGNLVGWLIVDVVPKPVDWLLKTELQFVQKGGWWAPTSCSTLHQTAIIIPYRDRDEHLQIFLRQIHPILMRSNIHYRIFVIEQSDTESFNRGKLLNIGFKEAQKYFPYTCFVFHDVDLVPEDDRIYYSCKHSPMHLSVAVDKFNYVLPYVEIFGGVEMFTRNDFELVNGFPNMFWNWGGEDDNLQHRCKLNKLEIYRPSIQIARYRMLKHINNADHTAHAADKRWSFLLQSKSYVFQDGLNSLQYSVLNSEIRELYTLIQVDLRRSQDKIFV